MTDLRVRIDHRPDRWGAQNTDYEQIEVSYLDDSNPANIGFDGRNIYITDTTTFSVIFSPAGKLVIHGVQVVNRDGITDYTSYPEISFDDVFNKIAQVDARFNGADLYSLPEPGAGMFYQDDYADLGLGAEFSRNGFVIYDRTDFYNINNAQEKYDYLMKLKPVFINPYTGTIINSR